MTQWPENTSRPANSAAARLKLLTGAVLAFAVVALGAYGFVTEPPQQPKPVAHQSDSGIVRTTPDSEAREVPPPVKGDNG